MELSLSSQSLLSLTKTLNFTRSHLHLHHHHHHRHFLSHPNPNFSRTIATLILSRRLRSSIVASTSSSFASLRSLFASSPPVHRVPFSTAFFASGGGSGGGIGGGDGDGDGGGSGGGGSKIGGVSGGADDVSPLSPDVIILDVGGMTCGGCAASVKRILENQPQVSSASVNLATETAIVWTASEVKAGQNWQQEIGEKLANQLTSCGFQSSLRDPGRDNLFRIFERKIDEKRSQLKESGRGLAVSWALCAVCVLGHLSHFIGVKASWIHAFHSTGFHLSMSLFALLGPGRQLIGDGLKSLFRGAPNMNTLVALGALSSFTVSSLATFIPKLGWKAFFEEPIMLIAFVLLGRNLEHRAKIKATSDLTSLLSILPSKARLLVNVAEDSVSTVEVPCSSLVIGDKIVVRPGDRVPADGIVRAGRSTVDESSFSGEPLPVMKLPGAEVSAGSINLNGTLTIEVQRPGGETAISDIIRLVGEAQSREAPIQRLADKVAGHFTYSVMAFSAATFTFWTLFGSYILPSSLIGTNSVSLALQLSCTVLVVACPCALGLATPTAVLVGTSLGAKKGLLLRGGDVLEKFSAANMIVFDKTGTLTIGKPVVTKVVPLGSKRNTLTNHESDYLSEYEILKLAAGVESSTIHPVGKAIVEAARSINGHKFKAIEGTFIEEPGSGAVATVGSRRVAVGTLDWVKRHTTDSKPFLGLEEQSNQSVVYVGVDGNVVGLIYIEDQIREDAKHVVQYLSKQGIDVYMLSGDKRSAAEHVASIVGIPKDKVFAGVKPDQKKTFITHLQNDNNIVAMVGDGINDAAALTSSHVGVAMGEGVGAASEVSSIVLMGNKLTQVVDALELSKLTMKTIKQNLWWAFGYNIVGIPIAAGMLLPFTGVMLTPSIAGALMGLSSLGVMTNSLLLRFKFRSKRICNSEVSSNVEHQSVVEVVVDENGKAKNSHSSSGLKSAS